VFGEDDELGTINLLDAQRVLAGVAEVVLGDVYSLNWRVNQPATNPFRPPPVRVHMLGGSSFVRDDRLEPFYLQFSTQWDGLRHAKRSDGFYNGTSAEAVDHPASTALGIQNWSEHGIVGRGVLLDVARHQQLAGDAIDPAGGFEITRELLDVVAESQGVNVLPGDIILVRTGWAGWYGSLSGAAQMKAFTKRSKQPGLAPNAGTVAWLWDHHVSAVAADNSALEVLPLIVEEGKSLHRWLLAGLGMPIGEHFWLDDLAKSCASDGKWSFLFASAPLNVPGGVGSPANALAVR
jgi:kynurenine formamidase